MDMGLALHKVFQQAGLPAPQIHMDLPWEMIELIPGGSTMYFVLCCQQLNSSIFPSMTGNPSIIR